MAGKSKRPRSKNKKKNSKNNNSNQPNQHVIPDTNDNDAVEVNADSIDENTTELNDSEAKQLIAEEINAEIDANVNPFDDSNAITNEEFEQQIIQTDNEIIEQTDVTRVEEELADSNEEELINEYVQNAGSNNELIPKDEIIENAILESRFTDPADDEINTQEIEWAIADDASNAENIQEIVDTELPTEDTEKKTLLLESNADLDKEITAQSFEHSVHETNPEVFDQDIVLYEKPEAIDISETPNEEEHLNKELNSDIKTIDSTNSPQEERLQTEPVVAEDADFDGVFFNDNSKDEIMPWNNNTTNDVVKTEEQTLFFNDNSKDEIMPWNKTASQDVLETEEPTTFSQLEDKENSNNDEDSFFAQLSSQNTDQVFQNLVNEAELPETKDEILISEDLNAELNDDDDFLKELADDTNVENSKNTDTEPAEDNFDFLAEDDDILLDDIMDDDLLDDDDDQQPSNDANKILVENSQMDNTALNNEQPAQVSKYQPAKHNYTPQNNYAPPLLNQTSVSNFKSTVSDQTPPVQNSFIPQALQPKILTNTQPDFGNSNQKLVKELKQEKKKSDAYDFPQDLFPKKEHTISRKVSTNLYKEIANSSKYPPVQRPSSPFQQNHSFVPPPPVGSASKIPYSPIPSAINSNINVSSKSSRSNSTVSGKVGSFFAELPVVQPKVPLTVTPKVNRYESIEKASSLMNPPVSSTPPIPHLATQHHAPTAFAYSMNSLSTDSTNSFNQNSKFNSEPPVLKKSTNPYAPATVGGHVRSISKITVDPDEIKANLVPVPQKPSIVIPPSSGNFSNGDGFTSPFQPNRPTFSQGTQEKINNQPLNKYSPNVSHFPASNIQPMVNKHQNLSVPPHANLKSKSAARNRQSISSLNDVYGSNIVTSNATSMNTRKASAAPPISGKHPIPVNTFTPAPVVINPENLVRRQWPLFSFSAENKVASLIPTYDSYNNVIANINIVDIKNVIKKDSDLITYPGPLVKNKTKAKVVSKWIEDKLNLSNENQKLSDVEELIWKCLKEMVDRITKPGDFFNTEYVKSIATILNPSLSLHDAGSNAFDILELTRITQNFNADKPFNSFALNDTGLKTIHDMLEVGNKKSALEFALAQGDWTMALLISNLMGSIAFNQVIKLYSLKMLPQNSLGHDLSFFIQSTTNGSFTLDNFVGKESWIVENYKIVIPFIMMDNLEYGRTLNFISNLLLKAGYSLHAKLLQILSGTSIPHQSINSIPTSINDLIINEIYDFVLLSSGNHPPNFASGFPHMITSRVAHAGYLADVGLVTEAKKYIDAAQTLITSKTIFCDPITLSLYENLCDRLSQVHSGWLSSRLSRPQLDKVWTTLDKSFNKFVAGEELPQAEKKTEGVFSKFTSPAPISRTSSSLDLNDVKQHINNSNFGTSVNQSYNNNRIPPNYAMPPSEPNYMKNGNKYHSLNHKSSLNELSSNQYAPVPPVAGRYESNATNATMESGATFGKSASTLNIANENGLYNQVPPVRVPPTQNSPRGHQTNKCAPTNAAVQKPETHASFPAVSNVPPITPSFTNKYSPIPISAPVPVSNTNFNDMMNEELIRDYSSTEKDILPPVSSLSSAKPKSPVVSLPPSVSLPVSANPPPSTTSSAPPPPVSSLPPSTHKNILPPMASSKRKPINRYAVYSGSTIDQDESLNIMKNRLDEENRKEGFFNDIQKSDGSCEKQVEEKIDNYSRKEETTLKTQNVQIDVQDEIENAAAKISNDFTETVTNDVVANDEALVQPSSIAYVDESFIENPFIDQTEITTEIDNSITETVPVNDTADVIDQSIKIASAENSAVTVSNVVNVQDNFVEEASKTSDEVRDVDENEEKFVKTVDAESENHIIDVEEPIEEEPKSEEPKIEEPKIEEPKIEEPKIEEPKIEEPKIVKSPPSFPPVGSNRSASRSINRFDVNRNNKSVRKQVNPYASRYAQKVEPKKSNYAYAPVEPVVNSENPNETPISENTMGDVDMFSFGGYSIPEPTKVEHVEEEKQEEIHEQQSFAEEEEKEGAKITVEEDAVPLVPTFNKPKTIDLKGSPLETMFTPPTSIANLNDQRRVSSPIYQFTEEKRYHAEDTGEYYDEIIDDSDDEREAKKKEEEKMREEEAARKEKENERLRKEKEEEKKKNSNKKQNDKKDEGGSWFGWLSKGRDSDKPKPIKAKLGEENSFYYDETLKRWINKKAPLDEQLETTKGPPPPPVVKKAATVQNVESVGTTSSLPAPSISGSSISPPGPPSKPPSGPPSISASPLGPPMGNKGKKDGIDELLSMNTTRSTRGRRGQRRGYVDVMAEK